MKKKAKKRAIKSVRKATKKVAKPSIKKNTLGTPYGDRVLVKPVAAGEVTSFGIIIPDSSKEKPEQGVVVAVGPGKRSNGGALISLDVKVGDTIMFNKYGYDEVKIDGTEYYLIREDNITYIL